MVIDSSFLSVLFFSFSWVMDDLSSKEGIGLQASSFLTELWGFHLVCIVVLASSDIHGPPMTSSLIALSVRVDLPQRALKSLSWSPYLLLG